jgi:hypothetical protein
MAFFWVVAPCSRVEGPDEGGSKDLWNVGKFLPEYTALQPRRQPSSDIYLSYSINILPLFHNSLCGYNSYIYSLECFNWPPCSLLWIHSLQLVYFNSSVLVSSEINISYLKVLYRMFHLNRNHKYYTWTPWRTKQRNQWQYWVSSGLVTRVIFTRVSRGS